jgi:hypothetical protein
MDALSDLLTSVTAQAKPTKPPLPERGLERIQAQWEGLTDQPFDIGTIQKLINTAKSQGGGAQTVSAVFDEVFEAETLPPNLAEHLETLLRGRLAITTTPPREGTRRGHVTVYNAPVPDPIEPREVFARLVAFAHCLGVVRTIHPAGVAVPMNEVTVREDTVYIGQQPATEYYEHSPECVKVN